MRGLLVVGIFLFGIELAAMKESTSKSTFESSETDIEHLSKSLSMLFYEKGERAIAVDSLASQVCTILEQRNSLKWRRYCEVSGSFGGFAYLLMTFFNSAKKYITSKNFDDFYSSDFYATLFWFQFSPDELYSFHDVFFRVFENIIRDYGPAPKVKKNRYPKDHDYCELQNIGSQINKMCKENFFLRIGYKDVVTAWENVFVTMIENLLSDETALDSFHLKNMRSIVHFSTVDISYKHLSISYEDICPDSITVERDSKIVLFKQSTPIDGVTNNRHIKFSHTDEAIMLQAHLKMLVACFKRTNKHEQNPWDKLLIDMYTKASNFDEHGNVSPIRERRYHMRKSGRLNGVSRLASLTPSILQRLRTGETATEVRSSSSLRQSAENRLSRDDRQDAGK